MNATAKADDYAARYQATSIELDCPPGGVRPADLIGGVLKGTGLTEKDFDTGNPFFGHQTWVLKSGVDPERFRVHKPLFKSRVEALYHEGFIRYGTW